MAAPRFHYRTLWINKKWEFTAFRCEFPFLAGAQGLELHKKSAFFNFCYPCTAKTAHSANNIIAHFTIINNP